MLKTICQIMIAGVLMLSNQESTEQNSASYMIECIEAECSSRIYIPVASVKGVENEERLFEIQEELEHLTTENIDIYIEDGSLDTSGLVDGLARCWQQYRKKNYYVLSVAYVGKEEYRKDAMTPFLGMMEDECIAVLDKELAQNGGYLDYVRVERLRGLDIYTFCITNPEKGRDENEYVVILNGTWENKEVCWQYVTFTTTGYIAFRRYGDYATIRADINYDGFPDLLIREGYSGGSGGSWTNYRGIIWKEDSGEFIWYESFPTHVSSAEYMEQRLIDSWCMGVCDQHVVEYKVVDGEYTATRELAWITDAFSYNEAGNLIDTLFYYEMGVLVREHDVSDMTCDEIYALYPDLDYWQRG